MKKVLLPIIAGALFSTSAFATTIPTGHVLIGTNAVPAIESPVTIKMLNDEGFRIVANTLFVKAADHTISISLYDLQGKNRFQIKQMLKDAFKAEIADAVLARLANDSHDKIADHVADKAIDKAVEEVSETIEETVNELSYEEAVADIIEQALTAVANNPTFKNYVESGRFAADINTVADRHSEVQDIVDSLNSSFGNLTTPITITNPNK